MQRNVAFLVRFIFSLAQTQCDDAFLVRLAFPQSQICRRSRSHSGVCPRSGFCLRFLCARRQALGRCPAISCRCCIFLDSRSRRGGCSVMSFFSCDLSSHWRKRSVMMLFSCDLLSRRRKFAAAAAVCPRSGFCPRFLLRPPSGTRPLPGHLLPLLHFFG